MLVAAGFFGYMLALLQRRVGLIGSSQNVSSVKFCVITQSRQPNWTYSLLISWLKIRFPFLPHLVCLSRMRKS